MANVKISDLTAYTDPVATDVLPIVDLVNDQTKKVKVEDLLKKFGAGTEALPSFAFTGDLDTGIYSPGANQFAVSTGGTQRLLIDASGNTTIQGDLTVNGTTTTIESTTLSIEDKNIELGKVSTPSDTTADGGGITLKGATDKTINWVQSTGCWTFNQPTNFNNHVRIDSSGKVGVGLTSPQTGLHISDGSSLAAPQNTGAGRLTVQNSSSADIQLMSANTGYNHIFFGDQDDANVGVIYYQHNSNANAMVFATNASERMRIDSSGRLLLGTTTEGHSAGDDLTVANSGNCGITIRSGTSSEGNLFFSDGTSGNDEVRGYVQYNHSSNALIFASNASEAMRLDTSGNVGIGTTSPSFSTFGSNTGGIHIKDVGSSNTGIKIEQGSNHLHLMTSGSRNFIHSGSNIPLAFSTNGSERMRIDSSGNVGIGTTSPSSNLHIASSLATIRLEDSDVANGASYSLITSSSNGNLEFIADPDDVRSNTDIRFSVDGSEAARFDSSGRLLVGTTVAYGSNDNVAIQKTNAAARIGLQHSTTSEVTAGDELGILTFYSNDGDLNPSATIVGVADLDHAAGDKPGRLVFSTTADGASSPTERMRIDSSGLVNVTGGIQVTENVTPTSGSGVEIFKSTSTAGLIQAYNRSSSAWMDLITRGNTQQFHANGSERMRIDSSGRLLVGTTSSITANTYAKVSVVDPIGAEISLGRNDSSVTDGNSIGAIRFYGNDGGSYQECAHIIARADGDHANNDKPSRLVFSTTADGASSATERMRIDSSGNAHFGRTSSDTFSTPGVSVKKIGKVDIVRNGGSCMAINRRTNDGDLIDFYQNDVFEGNISVSGTTISYNGAHLSRWSQLASGAERTEILRGSVLSNLDEMCEWGDEDNEQLNRMQVSNVEGDRNVAGVFQAWDDDDDTYINDFYCAMTGDFVIRIAQGTTVTRGDLLMSAGDGTAKPQDDDIVRSKTIAKVTSTTVSTTYADGSYCVPCVLMAC